MEKTGLIRKFEEEFGKKALNPKLKEIIKKVKANWIEKSKSSAKNTEVGKK